MKINQIIEQSKRNHRQNRQLSDLIDLNAHYLWMICVDDVLSQDNNISNYFSLKQRLLPIELKIGCSIIRARTMFGIIFSSLRYSSGFFHPTTRIPFYNRRVHIFSLSHFYQMDMFRPAIAGHAQNTHSMNRNALKNVGKLWKTCSAFRFLPNIHSQHDDIAFLTNPVSSRR